MRYRFRSSMTMSRKSMLSSSSCSRNGTSSFKFAEVFVRRDVVKDIEYGFFDFRCRHGEFSPKVSVQGAGVRTRNATTRNC